jgi:chromosome segregation ATPase
MSDEETDKQGIFKKLGSTFENLIFTHEQTEEPPPAEAEEPAASEPEEQPVIPPSRTKKDDTLVNTILKSAAESGAALTNFEGYLKTFEGIITDEGSRYKAAFAALAKNESLTVKQLMDAATAQINSLKNEKDEFLESIKEKNEEVAQLNAEMTKIDQRIADMQRQVTELQVNKTTKTELVKKLSQNIQKGQEKFDAALVAAEQALKAKKTKLQMYLKNM